jgi:protocatechuate 3,4-dioxygenase alpha subunit
VTDPFEHQAFEERCDNQSCKLFGQTPSQTVGPFFHYGLPWKGGADLVSKSHMGARADNVSAPSGVPQGEVIELRGGVIDGDGEPVPDAMLEIWQANTFGRYASVADTRVDVPLDPHFLGFGRTATSTQGQWHFRTIRPGRVPGADGALQAPHIALSVFGRGLLKRLATRIYFSGCIDNDDNAILKRVPARRRHTLLAVLREGCWWFDVKLQGPDETVFFAL